MSDWLWLAVEAVVILLVVSFVFVLLRALYRLITWPIFWLLGLARNTQHGSARWARPGREIRKFWLTHRGPIFLGIYRDFLWREHAITTSAGQHVLVAGPTGAGKSAGVFIP